MNIEIGDDYLDSRDIDERIDELNSELESLYEVRDEIDNFDDDNYGSEEEAEEKISELRAEYERLQSELQDELDELKKWEEFKEKVSSGEWAYGMTFINDSVFTEYIKELCSDCGYIAKDFPWWIAIDWDETADNCRQNYKKVEMDGETYLFDE